MKFLNDRIRLGFRNEKALINEQILSEKEFLAEIIEESDERTKVYFAFGGNEIIFDRFITSLANYIIKKYERKLLKHILHTNFNELKNFKLQEIINYIGELESDKELGYFARQKTVKNGLYDYFEEKNTANIEGLVVFRLNEYKRILNSVSERLLDIYMLNKEYEEFIGLLRYFVNVQTNRPNLIHIVVGDVGLYTVLNEKKEDITSECISDLVCPEELDVDNFDDLLISILITLAPEKIIVHNSEKIKNVELFGTMEKVFEKVIYCSSCELCNTQQETKRLRN